MSTDDIIAMAREAGYYFYDLTETHGIKTVESDAPDQWAQFERFAALVAAKEREACAQVAADRYFGNEGELNHEIAAAIRARKDKP